MRLVSFALLIAGLLPAQDPVAAGIEAFKSAKFADAAELFQQAVNRDPANITARLYLALAYMQQYIPGLDSPENREFARHAEVEFLRVLDNDGNHSLALQYLASLHFQLATGIPDLDEKMRELDQAKGWYERLARVDPMNKEAVYSLGVIAWSHVYPRRIAARQRASMKPEDPGPLRDVAARGALKSQYGATIDEGIGNLEKAIELDPQYDDAMAYLNLMYREKADLSDSAEEYSRYTATADEWVQRSLATKKMKLAPPAVMTPQRIRVGGNVQAANLLNKVAPIYPPDAFAARIQGTVRFSVIIAKDGHIDNLQLVSGHPLLVASAKDAVRQWIYKPTLLNGEPVEVVTQIDVNFTLEH